jgi:hypothetical protein
MRVKMKKSIFAALALVMLVGVAIMLPLTAAHAVEVFSAETELRQYNPEKSYGGYFMPSGFGAMMGMAAPTTYLMDMQGYIVHQWAAVPGWAPQLQEDGTLWSGGYIQDWDGNIIWEFTTPPYMAHHDFRRMWNKKLNQWTMLVNCNRTMTQAEAVAMGMDPSVTYGNRLVGTDFVAEVNMAKQIVWEWYPWHHGCQSVNSAWPNYVSNVKDAPGRLDVNWLTDNQQPAASGTAGVVNDWFHVNSIDYNEDLGQVVINEKHWSQFIVVDHDKTFVSTTDFTKNAAAAAGPDGDIIYRWGAPANYNAGASPGFMTEGDNQMYGSHNIQWIMPYHWKRPHLSTDTWPDPATYTKSGVSLPGAGHFLIFDNGCYNPTGMRSRILEINGRIGASGTEEVIAGQYIWPHVAGYQSSMNAVYHKSNQLVWSYQSGMQHSFYSNFISGCQRLPNGNTSINSGAQNHMFEVTPSGEVVWEYIYPGVVGSAATIQTDPFGAAMGMNVIYRHYRYGKDHPGLAGKDLTPQGTLTGKIPTTVGSHGITYPTPVTYYGVGYGAAGVQGGGGGAAAGAGGGAGGY